MTRTLNADTIAHVKKWEGLRLDAYPDPGSRNGEPWTIGYGHTSDSFLRVTKGLRITREKAEETLKHDLAEAAAEVERLVKVPLNDNQFGALVSFAFNIDTKEFARSTLLKRLNAGNYAAVPAELARWNKNDGKVLPGLVNRRAAETALWAKDAQAEPASSATARATAPPTITAETVSWGAGIVSTLGVLFAGTGPVQWALAAILVAGFGVGMWLFLTKRLAPK